MKRQWTQIQWKKNNVHSVFWVKRKDNNQYMYWYIYIYIYTHTHTHICMNIFSKAIQSNKNVSMGFWEATETRKQLLMFIYFIFEPWGIYYLFRKQSGEDQNASLYLIERAKGNKVAKTNWINSSNESNVNL